MVAINTYSDISSFINTVYEDALTVARENTFMDLLVTPFSDLVGMTTRKVTQYGQVTINDIGEADDMLSEQFTRTLLSTLTPAEKGAQFFLTDQRLETDTESVRADAAMELGLGMAQKIEKDIIGDFSSLTGGTIGSAGTTITWGHFFAALSRLRTNLAPAPYACVMHPYQWHQLAKVAAPAAATAATNAPDFQNEIMRNFWVNRVAGVDIFLSANITPDANDDAYGAMFSRAAMAYDQRRAPRLEPERDASRRGWELNMTAVYAHGTWRPTFGVQLLFDASAPSS